MSYTPIGWQTGDTITAEKLNKMDNGWSVESSSQTLFDGNVTTDFNADAGTNTADIDVEISNETIIVTFNDAEYTMSRTEPDEGEYVYGDIGQTGPDYSNYPFVIMSVAGIGSTMILTETAGTYAINIRSDGPTIVETADNFAAAVNQCAVPSTYICVSDVTTADDMQAAVNAGRMLIFHPDGEVRSLRFISDFDPNNQSINYYPTDGNSARFVDGVFTYLIV